MGASPLQALPIQPGLEEFNRMRTKELPETMCENQSRAVCQMHASCLSVGRM